MQDQEIQDILQKILALLGVPVTSIDQSVEEKTESTRFVVHTTESALLIGERGTRLTSLNHIVKKIVEHKFPNHSTNFSIDVNDYQKKHLDELRSKAHILAERARYFKSSVEMDPMSPYERMIVHSEFADAKDIETTSAGVGKDRHVVLKYTEQKTP